jgi:hypothetical protein
MTWAEPQTLARLLLTFDSGLERELILSGSDATTRKVIRGPQPEMVRDYTVVADGTPVLTVKDNFQRLRVHTWPKPIKVQRLEVRILSSHGIKEAHIMRIRAYANDADRWDPSRGLT